MRNKEIGNTYLLDNTILTHKRRYQLSLTDLHWEATLRELINAELIIANLPPKRKT